MRRAFPFAGLSFPGRSLREGFRCSEYLAPRVAKLATGGVLHPVNRSVDVARGAFRGYLVAVHPEVLGVVRPTDVASFRHGLFTHEVPTQTTLAHQ